jgi:hypothetical protein
MTRAADISRHLEARKLDALGYLFPAGKRHGHEFVVGNLRGDAGDSLKVSLNGKGTVWSDFATGDSGGDILDLWAQARCGGDIGAAMRDAARWLGIEQPRSNANHGSLLPPDRHPELGEPDHRYEYATAAGRALGYVCRWNARPGRNKEIRPLWLIASRWEWKHAPAPRPLYGLAELAAFPDRPVLIVEGEKAVEGARDHIDSHVIVTWPGGTSAVAHSDFAPLKGRNIILWPDNDDPGRKAMRAIADKLVDAKSVKGVKLPDGLPDGWDLGDAVPADLDPVTLIARAVDVRVDRLAGLGLVSAAALVAADFKPPRWAVPGIIPDGGGILAGKPKTGKSWMSEDFAIAVSGGGKALGNIQCDEGDVLLLALEDTDRRLHNRLKAVLQGKPAPSRLDIAFNWRRADEGGIDDIRAWLVAHPGARLVIIDTLAKMRGKPDRDKGVYDNDYAAMSAFKALADEFGVAILVLHHLNKAGNDDPVMAVSGTAGLTGSADTILVLKRSPGESFGTLYVRGRDVHETELGIQFDNDTGKWLHVGAADDHRKSEQRRAILRVLADNVDPMFPAEIAALLEKRQDAIRQALHRMHRAGEVSRLPNGRYYVAKI